MSVPQKELETVDFVEGTLRYFVPTEGKPATYIKAPGTGSSERTGEFGYHRMPIRDGREIRDELTLEQQGFELRAHRSAVTDFYDDAQVEGISFPEVVSLLKQATGATRVLIFDHTVRSGDESMRAARKVREPVQQVHNDYTVKSGPQRVRDLLPDEADELLKKRFAMVNVWRPIAPVHTDPLAVCDAQSIAPADLVPTDLVYADRVGEVYNISHNPAHQWYYFSQMQPDEVVLLKCFDSKADGRARFTAHTAFADPSSRPDAPPRESIEIRTLLFFDEA